MLCLQSWLLSSSLPSASQIISHPLSTHTTHVQTRHLLLKSLFLVRTHRHEDEDSLLSAYGTRVAIDARKPIRLCLHYW